MRVHSGQVHTSRHNTRTINTTTTAVTLSHHYPTPTQKTPTTPTTHLQSWVELQKAIRLALNVIQILHCCCTHIPVFMYKYIQVYLQVHTITPCDTTQEMSPHPHTPHYEQEPSHSLPCGATRLGVPPLRAPLRLSFGGAAVCCSLVCRERRHCHACCVGWWMIMRGWVA